MMNRQQRRHTEVKPQKLVNAINTKDVMRMQIHMELEEFKRKVLGDAVQQVSAAFIINLGELYGFRKGRLTKLLKGVDETFAAIVDGIVELNDLVHEAEAFGVTLKSKEVSVHEKSEHDNTVTAKDNGGVPVQDLSAMG